MHTCLTLLSASACCGFWGGVHTLDGGGMTVRTFFSRGHRTWFTLLTPHTSTHRQVRSAGQSFSCGVCQLGGVMHTAWVRVNAVVFFGLTVLLVLSVLTALSTYLHQGMHVVQAARAARGSCGVHGSMVTLLRPLNSKTRWARKARKQQT